MKKNIPLERENTLYSLIEQYIIVCIPCYRPHWIPRFWMNCKTKVIWDSFQTLIEYKGN